MCHDGAEQVHPEGPRLGQALLDADVHLVEDPRVVLRVAQRPDLGQRIGWASHAHPRRPLGEAGENRFELLQGGDLLTPCLDPARDPVQDLRADSAWYQPIR